MKNYFATGCLGVTPRGGCIVAAVCMIMVSIMHMVFENGHIRDLKNRIKGVRCPNHSCNDTKHEVQRNMVYFSYFTYVMLGICVTMCFVLLVSVYKTIYKGMLVYLGWNVLFEISRLIVLFMTTNEMKKLSLPISDLQWIGFGFRLPLQVFFMVYVVTYVLELMESKGRPLMRRRKLTKKRRAKSPRTPPALKFAVKEDA